jgi:hypothetical protein
MSSAAIFGSNGAEALFRGLKPHSPAGSRQFPKDVQAPRFKAKSDVHRWLQELMKSNDLREIEPGMFVCGTVTWSGTCKLPDESEERYVLTSASLHAVVAARSHDSLAAALDEGENEFQYLRMDHDPKQLGPLFKEPAPHVHVEVNGEPRFAASRTNADLPIADFVDFLFRNYQHDIWTRWLQEKWVNRFVQKEEDDVFQLIDEAFRGSAQGSNLLFLRRPEIRKVLAQLRGVLLEEKLKRCPLSIDPELWDIVAA